VKRDWCEAEASDSPHQNNTKVRLAVDSADGPHRQGQDCSSGAASNKLTVPEQSEMEIEECKVEASDPLHQDNTKVRSESAYQPQDVGFGATPRRLPVPDHPECKADSSCSPCQDNTEARVGSSAQPHGNPQDTNPGAAPHKLPVPDQPEMSGEECEAMPHDLPVPEQRGMRRDWCEAGASDSPRQNNTKVRLSVESAYGPHRQGQDCSSSAKLALPEQPEMGIDGCKIEASDSAHQDNTEIRSESAYEPHRQPQDGSSGAAAHRLPVPDHPERKAGSLCSPCQDNTEARLESSGQPHGKPQDTNTGAAPHELPVADQPEMKGEECDAEPSDATHQGSPESSDQPPRQPKDTSSGAAPRQLAASEQRGMETDSRKAEATVIPDINIRLESVEPDS
jgi:hypothetical protein